MLGKFLEKLDGNLFSAWQKEAGTLVELTHLAIEKINIAPPTPKEILEIKNAIELIRAGNISREQYVQNMKKLEEQFTLLSLNKEFNSSVVNDFTWHASRCYHVLNGALKTEYNKYAEAILNPAAKKQNEIEDVGMVVNQIIAKGAENITGYLLKTYQEEAAPFFKLQVDKMNGPTSYNVGSPIDISAQKGAPSLLEKKMGRENYQATQSTIQIKIPEDAGLYLAEQLHGKSFEAFYSHVATLYGIKSTIKKLAALGKTPKEIENEKQRLYREAGLGDLQSKDTKKHLDILASALGFKNAKELHHNFQQLDTPEGYSLYKQIKADFTSFANKDVPAAEDPLEMILVETSIENERIKNKIKNPDFAKSNANYAGYISTIANEISKGIVNAQRGRNLVHLIAQDYLADYQQNAGLFGHLALFAADKFINKLNFREYLDTYLLGKINITNNQLLTRIADNTSQINQRWLAEAQARFAHKKEQRNKLFSDAMTNGIDGSDIIEKYVDAMLAYKSDFKRYNKASSELDHHGGSYLAIKNDFKKSETDYINFREAFTLAATQTVYQFTQDNIDNHIAEREAKLRALQTEMEDKVKTIDTLQKQTQAQNEARSKTFRGRMGKFTDNVASFFGFKTKRVKKQEEDNARLDALYADIEPVGLTLHIQRELLQRAKEQKALITSTQSQNSVSLSKSIRALSVNYHASFENLMSDFSKPSDTIDSQSVFLKQQAFYGLGNQLLISLKALSEKLNDNTQLNELKTLPISELEDIEQQCLQMQFNLQTYKQQLSGDIMTPELSDNFSTVISYLRYIITEKKQIAQDKQLASATQIVTMHFGQFSIEKLIDPFSYVENLEACNVKELSATSLIALRQHTQAQAIQSLKNAQALPLKNVEQLYSHYQSLIFQLSNKDVMFPSDKKLIDYYRDLSDVAMQRMNTEHRKTNTLPISTLKDKLPDLGSDLLYYKNQVETAQKNVDSVKRTMESWIWNLFGLTTIDTYRAALGDAHAAKLVLDNFVQEYTLTLETYLKNVAPLFDAMEYNDLSQLIESLDKNKKLLAQHGVSFEKADQLMQSIITKALDAKKDHIYNNDKEIERDLDTNEARLREIRTLALVIEKDMAEHDAIPLEKIETYQKLTSQMELRIQELKKSLVNLDKKREVVRAKYGALGEKHFNDDDLRKQLTARLEEHVVELEKIKQKNNATNSFYETIMKGNLPEIPPSLDNKALGKGLILALQAHNHKAAKAILDFKNPSRRVDTFELSAALPLAAKMGSLDIVKHILSYHDMAFSKEHLNQAFREALNSSQDDIVDYLIFHTDFKPDNATVRAIVDNVNEDDPAISGIRRGWMQMVADNDGATLEEIRPWYIYLKKKCDSLALEANILKAKAGREIAQNGVVSDNFKSELNSFMQRINKVLELRDDSSILFENTFFESPQRKKEHLKAWGEDIDKVLAPYHIMITEILNPPQPVVIDIVSQPMVEELKPLEELELEREVNQIRVQLSTKQALAQEGVIIPQDDNLQPNNTGTTPEHQLSLLQEPSIAPTPASIAYTTPAIGLNSPQNIAPSETNAEQPGFERKDQSLLIRERLEQLLSNHHIDSPRQLADLENLLTQYKHLTADENSDIFGNFVQKAIYKMATENKVQALDELLSFVSKDTLQEISATALIQALQAGKTDCVRYLLKNNAALGHEAELIKEISTMFDALEPDDSRKRNVLAMAFEVLTHTKFKLIDPNTKKLDERLQKLMMAMQAANTSTKIKEVSGGGYWSMLRDNDKPKLDKLRESYVFAEFAFREVVNTVYFDFMDALILADPYELSERQVNIYEQKLKEVESTYERQLQAIAKLKHTAKTLYPSENFDNKERKDQNVHAWDEQTHQMQQSTKQEMERHIKNCKEAISEARSVLAQKVVKASKMQAENSGKRQSVILSKQKRHSTAASKDDGHQPSVEKKEGNKPNLI